jgi:predicted esterase
MKRYIPCILLLLFAACSSEESIPVINDARADLTSLAEDTGGVHIPVPLHANGPDYSYYIYEPGGYTEDTTSYPLLIYLHGIHDFGDPVRQNDLFKVLRNGPPKMIEEGTWKPDFPMLVASPQLFVTELDWQPNKLHSFIEHLENKYRVNPSRIYITGISIGGVGIFEYLRNLGSRAKAAAVVPIAGAGAENLVDTFAQVPIWAFHGENDRVIPFQRGSKEIVDAINAAGPRDRALLTTYPGAGHDVWTRTYDESGMGQENRLYDPFNRSVFHWMFTKKKRKDD